MIQVSGGGTKMPVFAHESQLRTEITLFENVIKQLEAAQSDTNALCKDDLRVMVSDCVGVAIQALRDERSQNAISANSIRCLRTVR
jgi:hypothetical protein